MAVEADIQKAQGLLLDAALDPAVWPQAVDAVARACGARCGQLIGINGRGAIAAHVLTGLDEDTAQAIGGWRLSDPRVNPRLRIARDAALLQPIADQDHIDRDTRRRHPIYVDLFDRYDLAFNCQTVLAREADFLLRFSVTRSAREGPLEAEDLRAFSHLTPFIQSAARVERRVREARTRSVIQAMEALSMPALLLDRRGRLIAASRAGDALLVDGRLLRSRRGELEVVPPDGRAPFADALARTLAASRGEPVGHDPVVLLQPADGGPVCAIEIQPLPGDPDLAFGSGPAVLIVVRGQPRPATRAAMAMQTWRLSAVEAEIAQRLSEGLSLAEIAELRSVSLTTVRSQLQAIYAKAGVHRQAELVAALMALGAA